MKFRFNFMKKNQVLVAVIGLMLIAAGYLNFTNGEQVNQSLEAGSLADSMDMAEIGDAQLVSTKPANDSDLVEENMLNNNEESKSESELINTEENVDKENEKEAENNEKQNTTSQVNQETTQTNAETTTDEYFTKSRLERDTMYSQMIESYQKILEKTTVSETQKTTAQKEITKINEQKNALMITENLIKTKGFEDLIIFINDDSINVIIKAKKLQVDQIAQIQNIITRELKAKIENIHITNKE